MSVPASELLAALSPERQRRIREQAAELLAEETTRQRLHKARRIARTTVARRLGMSRDEACRLERQCSLLLCTLRETIEAKGGSLILVADFPDGKPLELAAISEHGDDPSGQRNWQPR